MGLIKWIVAAAIGAVVGSAIWVGAEFLLNKDLSWLAVVVGVTTGLAVRASSAGAPVSYLRGGVSVIIALAAIVGARFALAEIMKASTPEAKPVPIAAQDFETDEGDDAESEELIAETPELILELELPAGNAATMPTVQESFSWMEWLWFALAGLIAYELGRGSEKKTTVEETEAQPTPDPVPPPTEE